jgi:hypothetical protein
LPVRLPSHSQLTSGDLVVAAGRYKDGILTVDAISVDLLATDPVAFFGSAVDYFYILAFARLADGRVLSSSGWEIPATPGLRDGTNAGRPIVIELERHKDGSPVVTRFRDPSGGMSGPGILSPTDRGEQQQPAAPVPSPDLGGQGGPSRQMSPPGMQPGGPGPASLPQPGGPAGLPQPGGPAGLPQPGGPTGLPQPGGPAGLPQPGGPAGLSQPGGRTGFPQFGAPTGFPQPGGGLGRVGPGR